MNTSTLFRSVGAGLSTTFGRAAATAAVKDAVNSRVAALTTPAAQKIDWSDKNWPAPRCGLLHFDVAELRQKRPPHIGRVVSWLLGAHVALLVVAFANLVDAVALAATVHGFSAAAVAGSLALAATMGPLSFAAVYLYAHGAAESKGRETTIARVIAAVVAVVVLFFALIPSGNLLGLAGLSSGRVGAAVANGTSDGAVAYLKAATVIESLAWLGVACAWGWCSYLMWPGVAAAAPTATAAAPAAAAAAP